jgi:hypothetical protein
MANPKSCSYCDSRLIWYRGIEESFDDETAMSDTWECENCGLCFQTSTVSEDMLIEILLSGDYPENENDEGTC